ncbi:MAG: hypothetical protein R6V19_12125 [Armatimonadota bacterium]
MNEVDCPISQDELGEFIEGAMPLEDARSIANHILSCDLCARTLGRVTAVETVIGLPDLSESYPELSPDFWPRLRERLDEVDRLVEATSVEQSRSRRLLPSLIAAGAALILIAVLVQHLFVGSISPIKPNELVTMHARATASLPATPASVGGSTATVGMQSSDTFRGPQMIDLQGSPALCWNYRLNGQPVSVMFTTGNSISLEEMGTIRVNGHRYHLLQTEWGTVLVDNSEDLWRVVVGRASPLDMTILLQNIPRYSAFEEIP